MKFKNTKYGDLTGKEYYGNINVIGLGLTSLEGAPKIVHGDFICHDNDLISLKGSPKVVHGDFDCSYNNIDSLFGGPEIIKYKFICSFNNLTSLKHSPVSVNGDFDCSYNNIDSLEGCTSEVQNFYCDNNKLVDLQFCPLIHKNIICNFNMLESLEGVNMAVYDNLVDQGTIRCSYNILLSTKGVPPIHPSNFEASNNPNNFLLEEIKFKYNNGFDVSEDRVKETLFLATGDDLFLPDNASSLFIF